MKKAAVDLPPSLLFVIQYVAGQGSRFALFYAAFRYPAMHFADYISRTSPQAGTPPYTISRIFTREGAAVMVHFSVEK